MLPADFAHQVWLEMELQNPGTKSPSMCWGFPLQTGRNINI
jgi:hypothetical protein